MIDVVVLLLLLACLPGSVELLLLSLGGVLPSRPAPRGTAPHPRLAVVVPAHDESASIGACVASLTACEGSHDVVVIADNCSDDTAALAEAAGARVLVRNDADRRGKGWALDFAFQRLLAEDYEAFAVVDADSRVDPDFVRCLSERLACGADAVQARYQVLNPSGSLRTRLMSVAFMAFNVLRPRGRDRWGLSAGILGNGFALSADTLRAIPYEARSVVEDLEYHLRLVRAQRRVEFADETCVFGEMPEGGSASGTQRARWEGGRLRMMRETAPSLSREVFLRGRWSLLEPLLELLLLPLSQHVMLLVVAAALPSSLRAWALGGLGLVGLHVLAGLRVGGGGWRDLGALAGAPLYVIWKLTLAKALARASSSSADWVRTARNDEPEG